MTTYSNNYGYRTGFGRSTAAPLRLTARGRRVVAVVRAGAIAVAIAVVVSAVMSVVGPWVSASTATAAVASSFETTTVVVSAGDTLWSIAAEVAGDHDPRVIIDSIVALNSLDAHDFLQVGQVLEVPVIQ